MKAFVILCTLCSLFAYLNAETITFFDGDFVDGDYTSISQGTGVVNASTDNSGGNPGSFRRISLTVDPFETARGIELLNSAVFNPQLQGEVQSVSVSFDVARVFNSVPGATQISRGIAVEQDGNVFLLINSPPATNTSFQNFSVNDIVPLLGGVNWVDGPEITFGFFNQVSTSQTGFTIDGGYDNFEVNVTFNPIPEPSTYIVLLFGFVFFGLINTTKRKHS
ncbi:PEP-CTERM sorting domain-containing protein [Candidatus Uabimicrobium amorphum]|uniref:PEP-CTERM protein-sorting domain-containing protein n=1 Tax=Uabimicrobium amorphum TaxID=2596890 RepID=A0A5S9IS96_UABAM|nr:PEP-CTERM sorting domain-containing protein [Candidatus Uabimicrobium amorphum]BBM87208.1 hypothetical protein UABAM_05611 [Candidatus Uabimicrobium amorphum]